MEAVLHQYAGVERAAVVGAPDPHFGQVPVAYVVPAAGTAPTEAALRAFASGRLAAYMVPERIVFVPALPLNPVGKVDHAAFEAMAAGAGG